MTDVGSSLPFAERDRKFYENETAYFSPDQIAAYMAHSRVVEVYVAAIVARLQALERAKGRPLDIVELGAGTCTASLLLRKTLSFGRHVCSDISGHRMNVLIERSAHHLASDATGIELVEADFTYPLPFEPGSFDVVLFDGALHHSRSIWTTLEECRRIVRPDGAVAALREAMLGLATHRYALKLLLQSPEVKAGVAENNYLPAQYDYYFRATGFQPQFIPVLSNWKWRLLAPLNGIVMAKWAIWATPSGMSSGRPL